MSHKATADVSYEAPRVLNLRTSGVDADNVPLYSVTFATFTEDAAECYPVLVRVLHGLENLAARPDNPTSMGRVARVEFIWNRGTGQRGAVFFDDHGVPLVHAVNALLGYDRSGSGPTLSRQIMMKFGVYEAVFNKINDLVRNKDYVVVLTREVHVEKDGVMHALPMMVDDSWSWHVHLIEED